MGDRASTSEAVRRWVGSFPAESVVDARSAPGGPGNAARVALSRLAAPGGPLVAVRRNVYYKPRPGGPVDYLAVARHVAGPGGGYAGWTAGWHCGWTRHDAWAYEIAVVGRPPRPVADGIAFRSRSNPARTALTWDEATLLEAVQGFERTGGFDVEYRPGHGWECDYGPPHPDAECLWSWPDPLARFAADPARNLAAYDPGRLAAAARSEPKASREFRSMMSDAADAVAAAAAA